MKPVIPATLERLAPPHVWLDARSGPSAAAGFREAHVRGARFIDLEVDLADVPEDPAHGGRHPLPSVQAWAATVGRLGIGPGTPVVVYDDKGGANAAARVWWMLRAIGHEHVSVLDGGLAAAVEAGLPMEQGPSHAAGLPPYPAKAYLWPTITRAELLARQPRLLVDVRAAPRFAGEHEPIDPVAGHIPGAVNHPLSRHLGARGTLLSPAALRAQLLQLIGDVPVGEVVFSCGSGVTACHGILALAHAGVEGVPSLYVGSWSEWCRNNLDRAVQIGYPPR